MQTNEKNTKANGNGKQHTLPECEQFVLHIERLLRDEKKAIALLRLAEHEHTAARKLQAQRMAEAIRQGIDLPAPEPLPEFRKAQQHRDALVEIRSQISSHDPHLLNWLTQLQTLQQERAHKVATEFLQKTFAPALRQFQLVLQEAYALKLSLNTADLDECFDVPPLGDWKSNPAARKLYDAHHDPQGALERLSQFSAAAQQRTLSDQRNKQLLAMDPSLAIDGHFRVIRAFTQGGRHFKVGEIIDRFSVPEHVVRSALVGQNLGLHKLRKLTVEEELNYFNEQHQQTAVPQQKESR